MTAALRSTVVASFFAELPGARLLPRMIRCRLVSHAGSSLSAPIRPSSGGLSGDIFIEEKRRDYQRGATCAEIREETQLSNAE
jgi:hypothetical protein